MASHNMNAAGGVDSATLALTAVSTTTDQVAIKGRRRGSISNESGGALTIAWYAAHADGGTELILVNTSNAAIAQTIADDRVADIPAQVFSAPYAFPVLSTGTAAVSIYLE